jgi:predicted RNA-binding protein with PIN domain
MDRKAAREVEAMIDAEFVCAEPSPGRVVLVDGFNVLHAVLLGNERDGGWWKREARERLLRRVRTWPGPDDALWVAFDGSMPAWSVWAEPVAVPQERTHPGPIVHSVFVESADDWIVRRARRAEEPARLLVVTGDRQVAGRARSAGAEISSPWSFISRCPSSENAA